MKKWKIGILGMGNMGKAHARHMMEIENTELSALCSYPREDAEKFARDNKLACRIYEDGFEMIQKEDLDALYICLPPFAHQGQLEAAAEKGIHIFVEKPIALSVERGEAMARAVKKNKIHSQVGYHMRFGKAVERFKELMDSGRAGRPTLFMGNYECNSLHGPWWRDVEKCGGQVFEQVIHLYDMALYLMGKPVRVSGALANLCHERVEGYTVEDTSISNLVFENGALGTICGSNCSVKGQWNGRFRVICENMTADFADQNHGIFTYTDGEEPVTERIAFEEDASFLEDVHFIEVLEGKAKDFATIEEGLLGLKTVAAVSRSSREGGKAIEIL